MDSDIAIMTATDQAFSKWRLNTEFQLNGQKREYLLFESITVQTLKKNTAQTAQYISLVRT